ncbi:MAG: FeoB-associated Cys-rich membrane protein [Clostridia bacterium]|nr:FeoB-associated Cys-rich membrane protein [Clostridia bacterium]
MHLIDWILIALIALCAALAVRHMWKKRGACCGDCAACRKNCAQRKEDR